jgi:hypothetical protein
MAFSNRAYFDEIVADIRRFEAELRLFCLKASESTIRERLVGRGTAVEGADAAWITRRVKECVAAHEDAHFGEPVDTEAHSAQEIAENILQRLNKTK